MDISQLDPVTPLMNPFALWLKQRRKEYGYTQEQLGELIGYSAASIRKLEDGTRRPSVQIALLLAEHLDIPMSEREAFVRSARMGQSHSAPLAGQSLYTVPMATQAAPAAPSSVVATNLLPSRLTPLIGRDSTITEICRQLLTGTTRLLTLTGPPGIGKTSLALEAATILLTSAEEDADGFRDGVFMVGLAPVFDPALVASEIATALGLKESGEQPALQLLMAHLRDSRTLLVLDNFEQVIEAAATLTRILVACPGVTMLVTSREALRVRGERVFNVPPLDVPDPAAAQPARSLEQYAAVRLFVECAAAANPNFELTDENAADVATICAELDGLPLALELVAARARFFSMHEIVSRLDRKLDLTGTGPRDAPVRQRTLRGAIEWSYNLLSEGEQRFFVRLGVFVGGFSYPAAEAVCNAMGDLHLDVLEGLESLLNKSLLDQDSVEVQDGAEHEMRFVMLASIREYALERLQASGEVEKLRTLHAQYYQALAEAAEMQLAGGELKLWLDRLNRDYDNIRAVFTWLFAHDVERALRLGSVLWRFWEVYGYLDEGRRYLQEALARSTGTGTETRANAAHGASRLAWLQGDLPEARALAEESLEIWRNMGSEEGSARAFHNLAILLGAQGEHGTARSYYEQSLALWRKLGNRLAVTRVLNSLGVVARAAGDYETAVRYFTEGLEIQRKQGERRATAMLLGNLGAVAVLQGEYEKAEQLLCESLLIRRDLGYKAGIADCLVWIAGAVSPDEPERAARLLGAGEALYASLGYTIEPDDRGIYDHNVAVVRARLDEADFARASAAGAALGTERAIEEALGSGQFD
ncbi:MAG: tetratricopeptide repeat protein [Chloroflexota bacterium]